MKTVSINYCTYPVVETFHSVQGEGFWTGMNTFFLRLGGCDVYCPWCDQKESWNAHRYPRQSVQELVEMAKIANPAMVVITGGEPLMHDLYPLTRDLKKQGLQVHLETSGAHPFSGVFDWVTFSPKTYKMPDSSIYSQVNELKIVVANSQDLAWAELQESKLSEQVIKYLQPEWNAIECKELVFNYVLQHPQWRVSLQTHKFLGVR
jgi:7-carboxy-7-deazaguanine synthase